MNQTDQPLIDSLRQATRPLHRQLEAVPLFASFEDGSLSTTQYADFLRIMAVLHAAVDRAGREPGLEALRAWSESCGARGLRAEDDLETLRLPHPPHLAAMQHAMRATEDVLLSALDRPASIIGALYVLHGSRHGARRLHATVAGQLPEGASVAFWTAGVEGLSSDWKRFLSLLEGCDRNATTAACDLAARLFGHLARATGALCEDAGTRSGAAALLNEDAGSHMVVTEPRVLVASVMAGLRCYRAYPYFELRYGERGMRFGSSDSAWLATLVDEPGTVALAQVDWLRSVLASRGMPSVLLEAHLRLQHEELRSFAAVDAQRADCLAAGAESLRKSRTRHLSDAALRSLETAFRQAVGATPPVPDAPTLVASAVADELEGLDRAVPSLLEWLGDETRFGSSWSQAVKGLVEQARREARR